MSRRNRSKQRPTISNIEKVIAQVDNLKQRDKSWATTTESTMMFNKRTFNNIKQTKLDGVCSE